MQQSMLKSSKVKTEEALNLKLKLSQSSVKKVIREIDWGVGSKSPMVVEFDPTTACNLACPDCISRDLLNHGAFSHSRIQSLTQEIISAGVRAVILIGGGEPLAHPDIGWVIDQFGTNGIHLGLTTNGLLMHRHIAAISRYMKWTRVSMDAGTTETYGRVRPDRSNQSQFAKAIQNIEQLAKVKSGKLGYSFMIYSPGKFDPKLKNASDSSFTNVHEIYEAARIAKEVGCDYFELKPMYDINHYMISQNQDMVATMKEELDRARSLENEGFKILVASKLVHVLNHDATIEPKEYRRCAVSQLRTLITPSGVYVCPYFRGNSSKKIGDANTTSLQDLWKGPERSKVMEKLDPSVDCRMHCIRHESNLMIEELIRKKASGDSAEIGETVDDFDLFI